VSPETPAPADESVTGHDHDASPPDPDEDPDGTDDDGPDDDGPETIVDILGDHSGLRALLPAGTTPVAADAPVRFKIRMAGSAGARSRASFLIEKRYAWRGYALAPQREQPGGVTLVAYDGPWPRATISVGFDGPQGLSADELYRAEVDALRAHGARLCEFTRLAVESGPESRELLAMLFHVAYMYAHRLRDCTDLLIEVNPRHERFYRRMLGFRRAGPARACPRVGGAPAVLLSLPLAHAQNQIALHGGEGRRGDTPLRTLYANFFSPHEENGIVGRLRAIG